MANGNGTATKPKIELGLNESATLKLMKDKPYSGENSFGPYFLYSVTHEGVEMSRVTIFPREGQKYSPPCAVL
jgi:hypothetical protein